MRLGLICPSYEKRCGVGEYTAYAVRACQKAGHQVAVVRTAREALQRFGSEEPLDALLVQHEYGLWQRQIGPNRLSEGEGVVDLICGLQTLLSRQPTMHVGLVMHTVSTEYRDDNARLIDSGFPLYSLHRKGAEASGAQFVEHGVQQVDGWKPVSRPPAARRPTVGVFGMYAPNKGISAAAELCRRTHARAVVNCYCRDADDRARLAADFVGVDAVIYDDFASDRRILERLSAADVIYSPQHLGHTPGTGSIFSASGSVRLMLNLQRPIIINRFWGYDELLDTLTIADTLPEAIAALAGLCDDARQYELAVGKIRSFAAANPLETIYQRLLTSLPAMTPPMNRLPRSAEPALTTANVGPRIDEFLRNVEPFANQVDGRGIVICAGGIKYNTCAWVLIRMLRRLGCTLPIQVWYRGAAERNARWIEMVRPLGVECVDAEVYQLRHPHPHLAGWALKPYAVLHSPFREVLLLDADNVPVVDPTYLFDEEGYQETGAMFWPDGGKAARDSAAWEAFGVPYRDEWEQESGQVLIDKSKCWRSLRLCNWFNEHSDFFYKFVYGDKDTFRLAWHRANQRFAMPGRPIEFLSHALCQHDSAGRRVFQHRCLDKWSLAGNHRVKDFVHEDECLQYVEMLRERWSPIGELAGQLPASDKRAMHDLSCRRFELVRQGHNRWPIRLDERGTLSKGWSNEVFFWWHQSSDLVLAGSDGSLTSRLRRNEAGIWEGRNQRDSSIVLQLVPVGD